MEGRGAATIHDVTLSTVVPEPAPTTSETLESLNLELTRTTKALARAGKALFSLETYLGSLDSQHLDVTKLTSIVQSYDSAAEKLDSKITELEGVKKRISKDIEEEKRSLAGPKANEKLRLKSTIGVFAEVEGEVEIALIYGKRTYDMQSPFILLSWPSATSNATWSAQYDIRVTMQPNSKEKPISLIYKGAITQSTGEVCHSAQNGRLSLIHFDCRIGQTCRLHWKQRPQRLAPAFRTYILGLSRSPVQFL